MERRTKKRLAIFLSVIILLCAVFAGLESSVARLKRDGAWFPDYEQSSIEETLGKSVLTKEDYQFLYEQTGLTQLGIDGLLERGMKNVILNIQKAYFAKTEISYSSILPYVLVGRRDTFGVLCALEVGDIIISSSTSIAGIRIGHAALVVDGEQSIVLESFQIGYDSDFADAASETEFSTYMVLRPTGIPESVRKQAVEYAKKELLGIPYNQIVGLIPKKFAKEPKSTQCSHLCWYAYKKFGYDIDSNGGLFVAPKDIANSSYFEVVQIYGFHPEKLWK